MLRFLIFLALVLGGGSFALSTYKNNKIAEEFSKKIDTVSDFTHGPILCEGFIKADCHIDNLAYQGLALADSMTLRGIDPLVKFNEGDFISLPLSATLHNVKYSLFDISSLLKDDIQNELQSFFKQYTSDYDVNVAATFWTDGTTVRALKIDKMKVDDKITPFTLSGSIKQLDTYPILEDAHGSFDFTKKRTVFNDFMKSMRGCCKDKFPERYLKMSDTQIWDDMTYQTSEILKLNLKNTFNQQIEKDLMQAMLELLQDKKNFLTIDVKAKKETPLEQTVMMFFIAGPDAVKEIYDINIKAK